MLAEILASKGVPVAALMEEIVRERYLRESADPNSVLSFWRSRQAKEQG